jgi:F0F1-type ATP synthase delta subunit
MLAFRGVKVSASTVRFQPKSVNTRSTNQTFKRNQLIFQQVKFASSHIGLVSQISREIKDLWGVTKDKKAKSGILHAAPKQVSGDSGRIANVLYSALVDKYGDSKQELLPHLNQLDKDFQKLALVAKAYPEMEQLFKAETKTLIQEAQPQVNKLLDDINAASETRNFFKWLLQAGHSRLFLSVAKDFNTVAKAYRGEVEFTLTTAQALSDADLADWKNKLSKALLPGETLVLKTAVNPSILSGYILDSDMLKLRNTGTDQLKNWREDFQRAYDTYQNAKKQELAPRFNPKTLQEAEARLAPFYGKDSLTLSKTPLPYERSVPTQELQDQIRKHGAQLFDA